MKFGLIFVLCFVGCAHLTQQDKVEVGSYEAQQAACVPAHSGDKAAIDACRDGVKAAYDAKWNQRFDGGFGE